MDYVRMTRSLSTMNLKQSRPEILADPGGADPSLAALIRSLSEGELESPAFSICATCGRRIDGTDKRKYCGRQCANRALLLRRRLARSRMIARLQASA